MASSRRKKTPPADIAHARSWIGKPIRDAYTDQLVGLVHGVDTGEDGKVCLLARFPGETESRRILLEVPADPQNIDFIMPGNVRARYRPLSEEDLQRLRQQRQ